MCSAVNRHKSLKSKNNGQGASARLASPLTARIPQKIKIQREKDYHTRYIGHCPNGTQFMGFIVGVPPSGVRGLIKWYIVVHTFDSDGNHLHTDALFHGVGDMPPTPSKAESKLKSMIGKLGPATYGDIQVCLFSVRVDGHVFGLIDASEPKEDYYMVELVPNGLAFFPPWNGLYET